MSWPAHADRPTKDACPQCGDRCETCDERMCAEYGPEPAPTCAAHPRCVDCDDAANTCTECRRVRVVSAA